MSLLAGSITATATTNGASTTLVRSGGAIINSLQITITTLTGGTSVVVGVYDNNVASSLTASTGNTWSGKSPGYSGQGPNTSRIESIDYQSARFGDQQGQTAPNTAGVKQYWAVDGTSGDEDLTAAPTTQAASPASTNVGNATYTQINASSATGNVVAAVTAARLLWQNTFTAGLTVTFTPSAPTGVNFGIDIVTTPGTSVTAIAGSYNLDYVALP